MLLDLSVMQRENIYSTGVTHDDRLMTIKIILKSGHWDRISVYHWDAFLAKCNCDNGSVSLGWDETQRLSFSKCKRLRMKWRAFSIRTRSGSRSLKLPFRKCCSFLCLLNVAMCWYVNKSELVKNCQL